MLLLKLALIDSLVFEQAEEDRYKNTLCVPCYFAGQVWGGEGTSNNRLWSP